MRAPLPKWSDSVLRLCLILIGLGIVGVPGLLMAYVRSPLNTGEGDVVDQPVDFDHRHHVRDDGIDCVYCHYDVERAPQAGVPDTDLCMNCHSQVWHESPMLEPVHQSWFDNTPIVWKRVTHLPDHVFFNHAVHVQRGVGCETCHGRVDNMGRVQQVVPMSMGWCLDCHRDPVPHLRPPELATAMGWEPDEPREIVGKRVQALLNVSPPTHCSACHR